MRHVPLLFSALLAGCGQQQPAENESIEPPAKVAISASAENDVAPPENAAAAVPTPAETQEPSPDLPLRTGYYVAVGADCRQPASPDFRVWDGKGISGDGKGISGSATRQCVLSPVATDARDIKVEQTCIDTYSGKPSSTTFTLQVKDESRFALIGEGGDQTYRRCPIDQVPGWLKDAKPVG